MGTVLASAVGRSTRPTTSRTAPSAVPMGRTTIASTTTGPSETTDTTGAGRTPVVVVVAPVRPATGTTGTVGGTSVVARGGIGTGVGMRAGALTTTWRTRATRRPRTTGRTTTSYTLTGMLACVWTTGGTVLRASWATAPSGAYSSVVMKTQGEAWRSRSFVTSSVTTRPPRSRPTFCRTSVGRTLSVGPTACSCCTRSRTTRGDSRTNPVGIIRAMPVPEETEEREGAGTATGATRTTHPPASTCVWCLSGWGRRSTTS
mmetsp:Transcript_46289/g.115146  ORF Transcript_46289/g.115146 Transcript_46289/m.115146 type:complete len:260 (+) Transcript_46289:381-1160(+)